MFTQIERITQLTQELVKSYEGVFLSVLVGFVLFQGIVLKYKSENTFTLKELNPKLWKYMNCIPSNHSLLKIFLVMSSIVEGYPVWLIILTSISFLLSKRILVTLIMIVLGLFFTKSTVMTGFGCALIIAILNVYCYNDLVLELLDRNIREFYWEKHYMRSYTIVITICCIYTAIKAFIYITGKMF